MEVGVVFALHDEALVGLDEVEEEVEVDELLGVGFDVESELVEVDLVEAVLVDVEDDRDERHAAGITGDRDFFQQAAEGVVLVVVGFEHLFLHLGGECAERAFGCGMEAERQEVEAVADEFVAADACLACGGHADDDVVLTGDAVEQGGERREQGGEEGAAEFRRGLFEALVAGGIDGDGFHRAAACPDCLTRAVSGQVKHGRAVGETGDPVVFRSAGFLARVAGLLKTCVVGEGHRGRQLGKVAGHAGVVCGCEFREDHAKGPAVANHVVGGEDEFVALV